MVHTEIFLEIRHFKDKASYIIMPKIILRKGLEQLSRREQEVLFKKVLNNILNHS